VTQAQIFEFIGLK